ncbi:hypothetical protein ME790_01890 [Lactobacillus delbrueckii]|uniref:hypothetical protein n=1 Tax=Lactobacillus delbrueckii TaxID=1584 RepID=UPI001F463E2B|nr:hypothetical protein [Lactobacillus delbrueckii]GHN31118.1 hypothetical protein ME790_01890 [Lactobacillus delbrueckii]
MGGRGSSLRQRQKSIKNGGDYSKPLTSEALPKLEGSDKQIEWANKIRKRFVEAYNSSLDDMQGLDKRSPYGWNWSPQATAADRLNNLAGHGVLEDYNDSLKMPKILSLQIPAIGKDTMQTVASGQSKDARLWNDTGSIAEMLNNYEKSSSQVDKNAASKFYQTVRKELLNELPNKSMQEWQSMPSGELEKADKEVTTKYMRFLRKYANKALKKNTSAGWWIDNFK